MGCVCPHAHLSVSVVTACVSKFPFKEDFPISGHNGCNQGNLFTGERGFYHIRCHQPSGDLVVYYLQKIHYSLHQHPVLQLIANCASCKVPFLFLKDFQGCHTPRIFFIDENFYSLTYGRFAMGWFNLLCDIWSLLQCF